MLVNSFVFTPSMHLPSLWLVCQFLLLFSICRTEQCTRTHSIYNNGNFYNLWHPLLTNKFCFRTLKKFSTVQCAAMLNEIQRETGLSTVAVQVGKQVLFFVKDAISMSGHWKYQFYWSRISCMETQNIKFKNMPKIWNAN